MIKKKQQFENLLEELAEYITNPDDTLKVISSGIVSLDIILGTGGIPLGRFIELFGPPASGKTTIAMTIVSEFLKADDRFVSYCDAEQGLSESFISYFITPELRERFLLLQPGTLEDALTVCEKAINSKSCSLVILDSIGSLVPQAVLKNNLGDSHVAVLSRIFTQFLQRNMSSARVNECTFIGINQVRADFGSYIKSFATPGGFAWKHLITLGIELKFPSMIKQGDDKIGQNTPIVIKKNKLATPLRSFPVPIIYGKGVDKIRDIIQFGEVAGIINKRGSYYVFDDINLGLGMNNAIKFLESSPEVLDKIKERCYNLLEKFDNVSFEVLEKGDDDAEVDFS